MEGLGACWNHGAFATTGAHCARATSGATRPRGRATDHPEPEDGGLGRWALTLDMSGGPRARSGLWDVRSMEGLGAAGDDMQVGKVQPLEQPCRSGHE